MCHVFFLLRLKYLYNYSVKLFQLKKIILSQLCPTLETRFRFEIKSMNLLIFHNRQE